MSLTRRLAAGLPAAGVTVLAALALTGAPAAATGDESAARAKQPAAMTTPCSEVERGQKCDYGNAGATPGDNGATPGDNGASPDDNGTTPTRGSGGYGSESPTASVRPPTPTASVDTVPPGGENPATSPSPSRTPGGVSAGGMLPVTGVPMGLTVALGGLMVAGGAAAVLMTRRRRSA